MFAESVNHMAHDLIDFNEPERVKKKGRETDAITLQKHPPPSKKSLTLDLQVNCLYLYLSCRMKLTKTYKTSLGEKFITCIFLSETVIKKGKSL